MGSGNYTEIATLHFRKTECFAIRRSFTAVEVNMSEWVDACSTNDIEEEDLARFDFGNRTFAIYRSHNNEFFCTDGLCTHEQVHLEDGLVMEYIIECPKHNGRFDYRTGEAKGAPVCVDLRTYPVKIEGDRILIEI